MERERAAAALIQRLRHSLENGKAACRLCGETFRKTVLAYELFNALHGNDTGTSVPYKHQELAAVQVCTALSLANGSTCAEVKDHGTDEMLYFVYHYHVIFFADRLLPNDGVKLEMLECFWSRKIAPSSASGASS